jgi:hypothetical protein
MSLPTRQTPPAIILSKEESMAQHGIGKASFVVGALSHAEKALQGKACSNAGIRASAHPEFDVVRRSFADGLIG